MGNQPKYISKTPDKNGLVQYTNEEHRVWYELYTRQVESVKKYSCPEFVTGVQTLTLSSNHIPQTEELSHILRDISGWEVAPVPALIDLDRFFDLLSNRKFPVATFIRYPEDFNYIEEPDIFHEVFGHCTMLTNPMFAEFVHTYGVTGRNATPDERVYLARLFWFTVEFGLVYTWNGLKAYGAGLNSSPGELKYSVTHSAPDQREFSVRDILRTPYRIDIYQTIYYVLEDFEQLMKISELDLMAEVHRAVESGDFEREL